MSHRAPFRFHGGEGGVVRRDAGPGGLVQVMRPVIEGSGGLWIAAADSPGELELVGKGELPQAEGFSLRLLPLPKRAHELHYKIVSTQVLAPLFHYLHDLSRSPIFGRRFATAWEGFRAVNRIFAAALADAADADTVLVEDFHLMLVADELRRRAPAEAPSLSYFHHVAWPEPEYFGVLPASMRTEILSSLLAFDSLGFHARRWAGAFAACCDRFLADAVCTGDEIRWRDRAVTLVAAPAAVDVTRLAASAQRAETTRWLDSFESRRHGRRALVRIDRADRWKNVERGFLAFEALLERRPELAETTWFVAVLAPTRMWIPENRRYWRGCLAAADRINARFHRGPVEVIPSAEDHSQALAALLLADCLLVNPVFDGLNIVAKEGAAIGTDSVVVLSRNAGAYEELGDATLPINPFDLLETAAAVEIALEMGRRERSERHARLRDIVSANTPERWLARRVDGCRSRRAA
jgi:trehalose 6-phosphate synthase